jgi:hypothetical protein
VENLHETSGKHGFYMCWAWMNPTAFLPCLCLDLWYCDMEHQVAPAPAENGQGIDELDMIWSNLKRKINLDLQTSKPTNIRKLLGEWRFRSANLVNYDLESWALKRIWTPGLAGLQRKESIHRAQCPWSTPRKVSHFGSSKRRKSQHIWHPRTGLQWYRVHLHFS